ncbi:ribonuclease D [Cellvibrio japonicus]|uniref:Ribonuclease D n=1 Tax=Cellvibrio japonicus (strain Ueda107) TaxID=498211 RepID=B3PKH0_CELJU|nr:ribonuclease D [Cellvibrio japonicus]ACE84912.1 ribonuclease D [Cellvibrio japonicus Ueda107]QEI12837.1 ribonuclease D [Cellvibrio japonicus]QEI16411.1 ribonuclease D [Cellvibrio japonicus]QEI19989.1 ribonuclease D [Cellvibrio japonicus]
MLIPTEPIWIERADQLAELCVGWRQQGAIAVDTEFMRTDTFYPIAGLLQIGDGKGCYLIDPLAIADWQPLRELLLDGKVIKVLHSCSEDLEVFQRWLDLVPSPLFDTQIGAAFANLGFGLGYANLVKTLLGIEIPKDETRSDWLQRPLSQSQLKYAALDVAHMLVVYGKLLQILKTSQRLEWVKSDCADLVEQARAPDHFDDAYQKVGFAWKLRPQELAVLRQLCIWRETQARQRDIPRNRLIKEPSLWDIARKKPRDLQQLQQIADIPQRTLRNDGETLLAITKSQLESEPSTWPERLDPPLAQSEGPLLKALKQFVRDKADAELIPAEVLIRKKEYEAIVRSGMKGGDYRLPERLKGWRYTLIGEGLLQVAQDCKL